MSAYHWLSLLTCAGHLAFVALALGRRSARPLSGLLALLALDLFVWNAADLAADLDPASAWDRLDHLASTLTTPVAYHFVLGFVGERGRRAGWLRAAYLGFGGLAALAALWPGFGGSVAWAGSVLAGLAPLMADAVRRLLRHERRTLDPVESSRARLVLMALASGVLLGTTDLARIVGLDVPRLSNVGTLLSVVLLAVAVLRFALLEARPSAFEGLSAVTLAGVSIAAYLLAFEYAGARPAALVLVISAITGVAFGLARRSAAARAARRERLEHDATLGRFAQQMAHDLKNPLAVVQGAAQFLDGELGAGRSIDGQRAFLEQIEAEVARMRRVIDDFARVGRVEPALESVPPAALLERVAFGFRAAVPDAVQVDLQIPPDEAPVRIDPDLVVAAIENLLTNAVEAMDGAGRIGLGARADGAGLGFFVHDDGPGMAPRVLDRAAADFFTTKPSGTGLGLSFARRVAEAHGGRLELDSRPEGGTRAVLWVPRGARR